LLRRPYAAAVFWKFERAIILAVASGLIAIATAMASMVTLRLLHAAPGEPVFTRVAGEYALAVAVPSAAVAYPFLLWGLLSTHLPRSVPVVALVSVVATPPAMLAFGQHGVWVGFLCSLVAMYYCRRRFHSVPPPAPA